METYTYIQCLIAGLLGILFHVIAIKIPKLIKRFKTANIEFSWKEYFLGDYIALLASFASVCVFLYVIDEIVDAKPEVLSFIKFFFVFIGYSGSSLLISLLGKADSYVNKVVDDKTNKADEKD